MLDNAEKCFEPDVYIHTYIHTHTHTHTMHMHIYVYIYYALTLNPGDPLRSLVESSISGALYTSYALP